MVDSKTPDNVIPFPKKYRRPTTPEQDKAMQKKIQQEHQKYIVRRCVMRLQKIY